MNVQIRKKEIFIEALCESETNTGSYYIVTYYGDKEEWTCTCPYMTHKDKECKHIKAVKEEVMP